MFLNLANVNFFAGSPAPLADFSGGISPTPSSCLRAGGATVKDSSSSVGDRPHGNIHLSARYLLDLSTGFFLTKIEKTQGGKNSPNSITQDNYGQKTQ